MEYNVDENGYYGTFGGAYIPEILYANVETLRNNYLNIISEEGFQKELDTLMRDYVGRPSPLYYARRLSEKYGAKIYLKREDLNHTGAHKINNTLDKSCSHGGWAKRGSSPRRAPASTAWRPRRSAH